MLTLLIDAAIGFIAAGTLASLAQSARAFLPTWRRLREELAACEQHSAVRVTPREDACTLAYRSDFGRVEVRLAGVGFIEDRLSPPAYHPATVVLRAAA